MTIFIMMETTTVEACGYPTTDALVISLKQGGVDDALIQAYKTLWEKMTPEVKYREWILIRNYLVNCNIPPLSTHLRMYALG